MKPFWTPGKRGLDWARASEEWPTPPHGPAHKQGPAPLARQSGYWRTGGVAAADGSTATAARNSSTVRSLRPMAS
jgi:hypothetical protein